MASKRYVCVRMCRGKTSWGGSLLCAFFGAVAVAASASSPAPSTADWPMFRGSPALVGVASGTLEPKLSLLWTFKTGKPVKSSPAIVGNRVFVGSDDDNLYAIDVATGN